MHVSQHQPPSGEPNDGERPADPEPEPDANAAVEPGPGGPGLSADPGGVTPARSPSLFVPVRRGPAGAVVRLWRTPFGTRTAVAFTSDQRLRSVLGPTQPWIRLSEAALRRMAEPLGARHLTVDPVLTARPPASWSQPEAAAPAGSAGARPEPADRTPHNQQPAGSAP